MRPSGVYGVSDNLARQAFDLASAEVRNFLESDMKIELPGEVPSSSAFPLFTSTMKTAVEQGLLGQGSVPEKSFLALWLIARMIRPELYVESGFFKGASIFSVAGTECVRRVVGFDPVHSAWRANLAGIDVDLSLHEHDFYEHDFGILPDRSIVYFDDHINSARRILEAKDKGFRFLIFDDSCGITGTCERMWPSLPSLFFIMNIERFREGDY